MVVSASRGEIRLRESSVSIQIVNREKLGKLIRESISEALRDIPGIDMFDNALPAANRSESAVKPRSLIHFNPLIQTQPNP